MVKKTAVAVVEPEPAAVEETPPTDEQIMYGDQGAPEPEPDAPPPAEPPSTWIPLDLDDVAPERLDVVYQGETYEMLTLSEIGTLSQKVLFKYWNRLITLEGKVRVGGGDESAGLSWEELDAGDDDVTPEDDAMIDRCHEMMIRCFVPSMPRDLIAAMPRDKRKRLVQRFLALISAPTGGSTPTANTTNQPTGATSSPASSGSTSQPARKSG